MNFDDTSIQKILLDQNYVTADDIQKADAYAKEHRSSTLDYFLSNNLISNEILGQAIAESWHVPYADLTAHPASKEQVLRIPEEVGWKYRVVLFKETPKTVVIATDDPNQEGLAEAMANVFSSAKISFAFALPTILDEMLSQYRKGLETRFAEIIKASSTAAPEIVNQIIEDALVHHASDIHIEPQEYGALVRFRIDGVLQDAGVIPLEYLESIVNRIKVQARLRTDEHFSAQDGAIRYTNKANKISTDLRVSIVPSIDGEEVAIRVLSSYVRDLTLNDVGLSEELQKQLHASAQKPFGMILVTGPTGSGKTTTLYSLLKELNTKQIKITTIEDPVEYKIDGISQIQTNQQANLTFAQGLRALARQDPDIILVGEIRDLETADIAVNAALTGHLLLSTFHANNAATAIPRFIEMGIEPFLVSSTIELIISQRLVRRLCNSCKVSYTASKTSLKKYGKQVPDFFAEADLTLFTSKGCPACNESGFKGRVGVFEYITTSPELQDMVSKQPSTKDIAELVKAQGFKTMFEDGVEKVKNGVTSIEELLRVVAP